MSDPRLTSDFQGHNATFLTCPIDNSTIVYSATVAYGSSQIGLAATFTTAGDGTVKLTEDGEFVLGRITLVTHDNYATVQVGGAMRLPPGSGATITEGKEDKETGQRDDPKAKMNFIVELDMWDRSTGLGVVVPAPGLVFAEDDAAIPDLVWVDETTGAVQVGKLLTTPKDPSQAVEEGVAASRDEFVEVNEEGAN